MPKISAFVHVRHPETFDTVTLRPGDTLPDWAVGIVTNPAVFGTTPEPEPAAEPDINELRARAKELGVSAKGSKAAILARIQENEQADGSRETLTAKAIALGIAFTEETTDAELELLIASKE